MGVARNLFVDLKSKCKCRAAGSPGDARFRAIAHGRQKVFEFEPKRLGAVWIEFFEREPGRGMRAFGFAQR